MKSKEWTRWLEEHMTPERVAALMQRAQERVEEWSEECSVPAMGNGHWMSVTSGSYLDWPTAGSPLPMGIDGPYIPVKKVRCWYCGGANHIESLKCIHCGAPFMEE